MQISALYQPARAVSFCLHAKGGGIKDDPVVPCGAALLGTGITFLATALGAATVYLFKREVRPSFQQVFLGFAAGVMVAASVWSLLIPAMEMAGERNLLPVAGGFVLGALFLLLLDRVLPHLHPGSKQAEGPRSSLKRTTMLVLAVTLHNIPEGLAVGLAFAASSAAGEGAATLAGAMALSLGHGAAKLPGGCCHQPAAEEGRA